MENLNKIIQGLGTGIAKTEATKVDEEAINRYITARNEPVIVATNRTIIRFKKRKEEDETPAE
ncbi:TPA: hypothetical protein QCX48_005493 [Bacillus mycoides]|uniref:hypothetical protein n=1 Tax=Bacillus TaxID=1386 RepID=UPI002E24C5F1|nr:hypothetical protein [Bacillus mycoides]MED0929827.1 hypothetical protein [Bacillus mycoides]HDR7590551.1 hypothetical protein [Bacillus mycoides]